MQKVLIWMAVLSALILPINAEVTQVYNHFEIGISTFVPCANGGNGEIVDLNGWAHSVISMTINGNLISARSMTHIQGVNGTGETTGDKYVLAGTILGGFNASLQNGFSQTATDLTKILVLGQGPSNNFYITYLTHYTFNANGALTVSNDTVSYTCK